MCASLFPVTIRFTRGFNETGFCSMMIEVIFANN